MNMSSMLLEKVIPQWDRPQRATRSLEKKVYEKLAYVVDGFEQFRKDQDAKDELVETEIVAMQMACSKLDSNFQSVSGSIETRCGV